MRGAPGRVAIAGTLAIAFALAITTAASAAFQWTLVQGAVGSSSGISGLLYAIACPGTTCWAVGSNTDTTLSPNPPLIETNSGSGWSTVTAPGPGQASPEIGTGLNGIACVDSNDCWAVGHAGDATLIDQYVGGAWATVPSPSPPPVTEPELFGVTCTAIDDCWAVGWDRSSQAAQQTLIEHYDGANWTTVPSPNTSTPGANQLYGVACLSADDCWAVGGGDASSPLIEHYDGGTWVIDAAVDPAGQFTILQGVTCEGSGTCWAVGNTGPNNGVQAQTLIEQYDGTTWARVPSPSPDLFPGYSTDYLSGVTCDAGNECWAVGSTGEYDGDNYGWSLIERYTAATGWVLDGFDPALSAEHFTAVACGALQCAAVGSDVEDTQPAIAQTPVTMASVGGSHGTSGSPPSGGSTASQGTAGPGVPDTGGAGSPWAALLVGGGIVTVALARRLRSSRAAGSR